MKTVLFTLGLTAAFFGLGLGVTKVVVPFVAAKRAAADSVAAAPESLAPLADAVETVDARMDAAQAQADSLRDAIASREGEEADAQAQAAAMASTLTRLEDDALKAIVQRLDGASYTRLYRAASPRNQGRLLAALTPDQAAAFIRHQLPGGSGPALPAAPPTRAAADRGAARPDRPARPAAPQAPADASPTAPTADAPVAPTPPAAPEAAPARPDTAP